MEVTNTFTHEISTRISGHIQLLQASRKETGEGPQSVIQCYKKREGKLT